MRQQALHIPRFDSLAKSTPVCFIGISIYWSVP
jgi:hypothetical protein